MYFWNKTSRRTANSIDSIDFIYFIGSIDFIDFIDTIDSSSCSIAVVFDPIKKTKIPMKNKLIKLSKNLLNKAFLDQDSNEIGDTLIEQQNVKLIKLIYFINSIDFIDCINFLYSYENKPNYQYHHLICVFLSSKQDKWILKTSYVPVICNLLWIPFILCLILVSLNKKSTYSVCLLFSTTFLLTHFPFLFF